MNRTTARSAFAALSLLALSATAQTAQAQTPFFGLDDPRGARTNSIAARALFLAALTSSGTDTIETIPQNTPDPALTFGATGLTAQTDVDIVVSSAAFATSGSNFLTDRFGNDTFTLNAPVTAFGLDVLAAGDFTDPTTVTLRLTNTAAMTSKDVSFTFNGVTGINNVLFFGVTDADPFNRVTFLNNRDENDRVFFDDVTAGFAAPVPGPAAPLVFALGGAFGGLMLRRRKK